VFHPLEGASKNHPVATERIGTVGYWSSKAAVAGSEVFGVATMGYFAWAAPLVTGGSIAAGWGTKKALQAGGVNDDAAGFYGGVVGLLAADGLSSSKPVNVAEGKLTGFVGRLADKASGLLPGLRTAFEQTVAGEAGFVRSPIGKAEAATSGAAVETTAVTDMRVSGQVVAKTPDYYARPDGEVIPATGYRYLSRNSVYLDQVIKTGEVPSTPRGTYFSFDKIDNVVAAPTKLQTPHDASIRVEFDTKQILDDVQIPRGGWGNANHLEPITKDYPEFGSGGATQAFTRQPLKVRRVVDLRTGEVLYDAGQ
jgi:hypothetical protein